MDALNGRPLLNKRIKGSVSRPPEGERRRTNIYLSGLSPYYSSADQEALVSPFGSVHDVRVLLDPLTGQCRGVGFAKFQSPRSAVSCIERLRGSALAGGETPLILKYAETTNDKLLKANMVRTPGQRSSSCTCSLLYTQEERSSA